MKKTLSGKEQNKILAIDLGATNMRFAIVKNGNVNVLKKIKTPDSETGLRQELEKNIHGILGKEDAQEIAVSVAGPVQNDGTVYLTNITQSEINLKSLLEKEFNLPVSIVNDTGAAVMAEQAYGFGKGKDSLVYVTLSSGVGGGVIENNNLRWASSVSDELGHQVADFGYEIICTCGSKNHWEAFSSGIKIPFSMKAWAKRNKREFNGSVYKDVFTIFQMAQKNDALASDFMNELGRINAMYIDMFSERFHPEVFVLGGSIALNNQEIILDGIKKYQKSEVPVKITELGDEISLLGAAVYFESRNKV